MQAEEKRQAPSHSQNERPGSARLFRAVVGIGLMAFGVLLFSLIFRRDSRWTSEEAVSTSAPAAVVLPPTPALKAVPTAKADAVQAPLVAPATVGTAPTAAVALVASSAPAAASSGWAARAAQPGPGTPGIPAPFFGPNYSAADDKPVYICGAKSAASALTLQTIQMGGFDVARGFHLGIVPINLNDAYSLSGPAYAELARAGTWDCMIGHIDENAELNIGVVTAVTDESAGDVGIAAKSQLATYEDLAGKRLGTVGSHTSKFFANYTLALLPEAAQKTVTLVTYETPDKALAAYLAGQLDAVSLAEPHLSQAEQSAGSRRLVDTGQLRVIAGGILTSRVSIERKPDLVQAFHTAWFAALKAQLEDFDGAAAAIAAWGQNQWTGVTGGNAPADLRSRLRRSAQATLKQNSVLGANPAPILSILQTSRAMWQAELKSQGKQLPAGTPEVAALVNLDYAVNAFADSALVSAGRPVNGTFSLRASASAAAVIATPAVIGAAPAPTATTQPETVAVLPCRTFTFQPNSTALTAESKRLLDVCVLPALRQRASIALMVRGSAAWPTGGDYTEESVRLFGASRASAIVDYLVAQGVERKRFIVAGVAPPPERRAITDTLKLAADRYVEMTLIVGGL